MDAKQLNRLSTLFEKVVANRANLIEKQELNSLYREYINHGRDRRTSQAPQYRKVVG